MVKKILALFFFNSMLLFDFGFAQQYKPVDILRISTSLQLSPAEKRINGKVECTFHINKPLDSVYLDAQNMDVKILPDSNSKIKLAITSTKIWFIDDFQAGKTYTVAFTYSAKPIRTLYFTGWNNEGSNQIFTQGQGNRTSFWLPSIDDNNDKIEFDLTITSPINYWIVANGQLAKAPSSDSENDSTWTWSYDMKHPMSSYLVALAVGKFRYQQITSTSGIPIKLFYEPKDEIKVESTYRYSKEIFDYLEKEIGVPYPWTCYNQVPIRDFLYGGMENTTLTIFAASYMEDAIAFKDKNYVRVNAHELAHQWFGDYVTQATGADHWLQEGFATYYSLLTRRHIFGEDYFYLQLYKFYKRLQTASDKGDGEAVLNAKASSLTFYQKGAWALHILSEKIGAKNFQKSVQKYLLTNAYSNVTTADFINTVESISGQDLSQFVATWLKQKEFPKEQALLSLRKSKFMQKYISLQALRDTAFNQKAKVLSSTLELPVNRYLGQEAVMQLPNKKQIDNAALSLYRKAFESKNIFVRQAIAIHLSNIPNELKSEYETLLEDSSYRTKEYALKHLWQNFSNDRIKYLDLTKGIKGFSDKNVLLLWLTLNYLTKEYQPENKAETLTALSSFTASKYAFPIRQNAFKYLNEIDTFNVQSYQSLLQGCTHRVWRFRRFCQQLLGTLLKDPTHKTQLKSIGNLSEYEKKVLENALKKG